MGLFTRKPKAAPELQIPVPNILLEGDQRVAAVGGSFYQPALLRICGARPGDEVGHECIAVLVADPENPHDANAVRVEVQGLLVAHLSRSDAISFRPAVQAAKIAGRPTVCPAWIAGRGSRGETANLGIFLHLPTAAEALARVRAV